MPAPDPWLETFPLIVHSHLRWDFVWQRPQQILSRLARQHHVLFIEDPVQGPGGAQLQLSEPHPNLVRLVPAVGPDVPDTVDGQCASLLPLIHRALREHPLLAGRFERPVQWFYSPMTAPAFLGKFDARGLVYDCMDELANFRFAPEDIGRRERLLISRADIVFTGGYELFRSKSQLHRNVHFHGCGVDVAHFSRARDEGTAVPARVSALPGPVLGYFGVIDERLDYDLLAALADAFPHGSLVMAGPVVKVDPAQLPRRHNIHWLGQQPYEMLPALVKGFDVCLMPFALNDATRYINPTKTLEYLAAGKPVVSTAVADVVRNFTPIVEVAQDPLQFVDAVKQVLSVPDQARIEAGIERAGGATWDSTVGRMREQMQAAVGALATRRLA